MRSPESPSVQYLFVYGTLLSGVPTQMAALLGDQAELIGNGYLPGRLFLVDGYPGAVPGEPQDGWVHGEVYAVTGEDLLLQLDDYEECGAGFPVPQEYRRRVCRVMLEGGGEADAWVYVYDRDVRELPRIPSGNFRDWLRSPLDGG